MSGLKITKLSFSILNFGLVEKETNKNTLVKRETFSSNSLDPKHVVEYLSFCLVNNSRLCVFLRRNCILQKTNVFLRILLQLLFVQMKDLQKLLYFPKCSLVVWSVE